MYDELTVAQEQDLVEFFYDQTLKDFKNSPKKDHLLDGKGKELGMSGECTISSNQTSKTVATLLTLMSQLLKNVCSLYTSRWDIIDMVQIHVDHLQQAVEKSLAWRSSPLLLNKSGP